MKILPLKKPIVSFSPLIDNFLSVLANDKCTLPIILENYIELVINSDGSLFEFLHNSDIWWNSGQVHTSRISRDLLCETNILDFFKQCIDADLYIFAIADTYYIEHYATHGKEHYPHDIFIYGYDNDTFHVRDYFDFTHSNEKQVSYEQLSDAICSINSEDDYLRGVVLFKNSFPNPDDIDLSNEDVYDEIDFDKYQWFSVDDSEIKVRLTNFLNDKYSNWNLSNYYDRRCGFSTGFNAIELLCELIKKGECDLKYKHFHLIYCHVTMMLHRIRLIHSQIKILAFVDLEKRCEVLQHDIINIRNLVIKYNLTGIGNEKIIVKFEKFIFEYRLLIKGITENI